MGNKQSITAEYPRIPTPTGCPIQLWSHQEAMLHRIKEIETAGYLCKTKHTEASYKRYSIETNVPKEHEVILGVLNDPPGSGKTYAILAHILSQTEKGPTLIIVPQNIYAQWKRSIKTIFQNQLQSCLFSTSYSDIMNIYSNPEYVQQHTIILLQDTFAEAYIKALNDNSISVLRVVVDEIDIMDSFLCSSVETKYVWLMSASYKDQKQLGPFLIGDHTKVICRCDETFVKENIELPPVQTETILCYDDHIRVFDGILNQGYMKHLHEGDHSFLYRYIGIHKFPNTFIPDYKDLIEKYIEFLTKQVELDEQKVYYMESCLRKREEARASEKGKRILESLERSNIKEEFYKVEYDKEDEEDEVEQYIFYSDDPEKRTDLADRIAKGKRNIDILKKGLDSLVDLTTMNTKETFMLTDFIQRLQQNPKSKWILFNDNSNILLKHYNLLRDKGIKMTMLDGGNQSGIDKILKEYKQGDTQVLLLNSMLEGAGMDLENTTHILLTHKTDENYVKQLLGRAQRYGRKTPLKLIYVYNKHE